MYTIACKNCYQYHLMINRLWILGSWHITFWQVHVVCLVSDGGSVATTQKGSVLDSLVDQRCLRKPGQWQPATGASPGLKGLESGR